MNLLGIALRKPSFNEFTAATVMGVGLWLAFVAVMKSAHLSLDVVDAGAALIVMVWGCVGVRLGIRLDQGSRHIVANVLVSAALLAVYQSALAFVG